MTDESRRGKGILSSASRLKSELFVRSENEVTGNAVGDFSDDDDEVLYILDEKYFDG